MAKPNFKLQKRKKELEKKKKSEEKMQRKLDKNSIQPTEHLHDSQGGEDSAILTTAFKDGESA